MRSSRLDERVYQIVDPPRRVTVELGRALDLARRSTPADRIPLWLRSAGIRIESIEQGELIAWCRLSDGQFLGCCRLYLSDSVGNSQPIPFTFWLTQAAIHHHDPSGSHRPEGE